VIIFDLDGTLVDSTDDLAASANATLEKLGLPPRSREEIRSFIGEGARRLVERAIAPRTDLLDRALELYLEYYAAHVVDATYVYDGINDALRSLPGPLAVATNKPGKPARQVLAHFGLLELFIAVLGGDEGPRKPDPALVDRLRATVAASREETVLVGDSSIDLETAIRADVRFVGVGWGIGSHELRAAGVELVESADKLVRALRRA
jgi:phosphoglycolate phosphatase